MNVYGEMGCGFGVKSAELYETSGKTISYRDNLAAGDRVGGSVKCIRRSVAVKKASKLRPRRRSSAGLFKVEISGREGDHRRACSPESWSVATATAHPHPPPRHGAAGDAVWAPG